MSVDHFFDVKWIIESEGVPKCKECGGKIKPDVVLYGENLNQTIVQKSIEYIQKAEILIVGGTSLAVYPAAGLIDYYCNQKLVLINNSSTSLDARADLLIQENVGDLLGQIKIT